MLNFSSGLTRFDRISIEFIRGRTHVRSFGDEAREGRLRWFERPQSRDREYVWKDSSSGSGRQEAWMKSRRDSAEVSLCERRGCKEERLDRSTPPPLPTGEPMGKGDRGATFCRSAFFWHAEKKFPTEIECVYVTDANDYD